MKDAAACPGIKRDGRCSPGAWLCRFCKRWHYLKLRPVRHGTVRKLADVPWAGKTGKKKEVS